MGDGVSKGLAELAGVLLSKVGTGVAVTGASEVVGSDVPVGNGGRGALVVAAGVLIGTVGKAVLLMGVVGKDVPV